MDNLTVKQVYFIVLIFGDQWYSMSVLTDAVNISHAEVNPFFILFFPIRFKGLNLSPFLLNGCVRPITEQDTVWHKLVLSCERWTFIVRHAKP